MGLDAIPDWELFYCPVCGHTIDYNKHIDSLKLSVQCYFCKVEFDDEDLRNNSVIFKPRSEGCARYCPIERMASEVCCKQGRLCCFYCGDNLCPIHIEYEEIIARYYNAANVTEFVPISAKDVIKRLKRI